MAVISPRIAALGSLGLLVLAASVPVAFNARAAPTAEPPVTLSSGPYRLTVDGVGRLTLVARGVTLASQFDPQAVLAAVPSTPLELAAYPVHRRFWRGAHALQVVGEGGPWPALSLTAQLRPDGLRLSMAVEGSGWAVQRFVPLSIAVKARPSASVQATIQGYGNYDGAVRGPLGSDGAYTSDWLTALSVGKYCVVAGALTARQAIGGVIVGKRSAGGALATLVSGLPAPNGPSPVMATAGAARSETLWLAAGTKSGEWALLRHYGHLVGQRMAPPKPIYGLSTWGADGPAPSLGKALAEAHLVRHLMPWAAHPYVEVDDGWERAYGDWRTNANFPGGLATLARDLQRAGVTPGLWCAPFLVSPTSSLAKAHPNWLVRQTNGLPERGAYGDFLLDVTVPGVTAFLTQLTAHFVHLGFRVLKLDFLYEGAASGVRHEAGITGTAAYRIGLEALSRGARTGRSARSVEIVGSGAPLLPVAPLDAWRTGPDVEDYSRGRTVDRQSLVPEATSAAATLYLDGSATRTDPDDVLLAPPGGGKGTAGAGLRLAFGAFAGGMLTDGDTPSRLTAAASGIIQLPIWRRIVEAAPLPPLDWGLSGGAWPPAVWRREDRHHLYVGVFNWTATPAKIAVSAAALRLPRHFRALQEWNGTSAPGKPIPWPRGGVLTDRLAPGTARVYAIQVGPAPKRSDVARPPTARPSHGELFRPTVK